MISVSAWLESAAHRLLVRLGMAEVQLMGCLDNFVHRGRVLFDQSGLASFTDPTSNPAFCVRLRRSSTTRHDLLGGNARYVTSLATGATRQLWLHVLRKHARFAIEARLGELTHAVIRWRQRRIAAGGPRAA